MQYRVHVTLSLQRLCIFTTSWHYTNSIIIIIIIIITIGACIVHSVKEFLER